MVRSFEVVGEAARRVSPEFCEAHADVPWRLMGDFRNKLIHDYFALDLETIRKTATEDAPMLLDQIEGSVEAFEVLLFRMFTGERRSWPSGGYDSLRNARRRSGRSERS